jgi:hypothetical protein
MSRAQNFPRLDPRRIDIESRWALRWLVRYSSKPKPDAATAGRFIEQLTGAFLACEARLHFQWVQANTLKRLHWRQEVHNLKRNPKRLREFAANEAYAQILRYGAARLDATEDLGKLIRQMEADPDFLERVLSAALEKDIADKKKRLLHNAGGRPSELEPYYPIVDAAGGVFREVTGRPIARSTTAATKNDSRVPGKATGPGIEFLKRLLTVFPCTFSDDSIAHLIRAANKPQ